MKNIYKTLILATVLSPFALAALVVNPAYTIASATALSINDNSDNIAESGGKLVDVDLFDVGSIATNGGGGFYIQVISSNGGKLVNADYNASTDIDADALDYKLHDCTDLVVTEAQSSSPANRTAVVSYLDEDDSSISGNDALFPLTTAITVFNLPSGDNANGENFNAIATAGTCGMSTMELISEVNAGTYSDTLTFSITEN